MLKKIFFPEINNSTRVVKLLLDSYPVHISGTTIETDLDYHPDHGSLLAISDVLTGYQVENIALKITGDQLITLPTPFIAQIKGEKEKQDLFTVVRYMDKDNMLYFNPETNKWENIASAKFIDRWPSGIVLIADAGHATSEKDYAQKNREGNRKIAATYLAYLFVPAIVVMVSFFSLYAYGYDAVQSLLMLFIMLVGAITGGLLVWYELDRYNPFLQQICSKGKKVDCGAILGSKGSKIFGISWSAIGFSYFSGGTFLLLFMGVSNPQALFIVSWLNVLAVPYVFYSLYYQGRIAKQWCVLCLTVQAVLVLQLITAYFAHRYDAAPVNAIFNPSVLTPVLLSYMLPFLMIQLLLPAYRGAKENKRNKAALQRLKHNPQIFEALLHKQKAVTETPEGLGIMLGNSNAAIKLIKVCNPYCGPCSSAHAPMEALLDTNPDLQIQIIFTATNRDYDITREPASHLLAIAGQKDPTLLRQALDEWYLPDTRDYKSFAEKYPVNDVLEKHAEEIEAMSKWCEKMEILYTPTFFVNGYQLPDMYTVNDLKYFLAV